MERQRQFDEQMMGGGHNTNNNNTMGLPSNNGMGGGGAAEAHMHHNPQGAFPAALLAQFPALQGLQWDQLAAGNPQDEMDGEGGGVVSGRSSFDASSGAESYFDEDEGGYVSGPGTGFGGHGFTAAAGGHDWASDYEGR